ncbi:RNA polymerase sporulation sigma factor SigK [Ruminococcus bovis]|mgnify:FL=1|uniref:RNA polymerase sigma factor n=1 Tax=Ruminococcus bovis TaxID=2564099 RepID=A0A4P8XZZ7_9FIRM|nr:RNA polymerase sporulation sigma factor SigK [Ruminococcus bovis]QCT07720.1 sigma-70 family RNA polymerase sigma factor [Ruminococcus bovis]
MLEFINFLGQYIFTFILHICGNGKFPKPLSEEKEKEYLLKSKNGDIKARNILVEHNLRLVAHIIKKYYAVNVDQDDLVSIGTIGLIKAINTFDMDKNIKLSSYASRCIENEILMHFRNLKKSSQNVSLEDAVDIDKDGNTLKLMDLLSIDDDFADNLDKKLNLQKINKYLTETLTKRELQIINLRYGLNGSKPLTQREVSSIMNISRSYVSRIEKKALEKLKERYDNN